MQCLVTGATGYLGRALTPALLSAGHAVIGQCATEAPTDIALPMLRRDFRAGAAGLVPDGTDCVLHLAGIAHQAAAPADYYLINVAATLELARDARARGVRRFVFVSSVKAEAATAAGLRACTGAAVTQGSGGDTAPADGGCDYAGSKAAAEAGLRELCADGAMELIIVRPALVYSVDAPGHLRLLRRWAEFRLPRPPAGGARSMIARDDLVRLLVLLTTAPLPDVSPLVASDGEVYSTRRLHAALCRALQRRPWLPSPPAGLWRLAATLRDRLQRLPPGSTWERLAGDERYPSRGLAELHFRPTLTFERSLGLAP